MEENPYCAMLETFRQDSDERHAQGWCMGVVRGLSPLQVEVDGELVTRGLSCNHLLLGRSGQADFRGLSGGLVFPDADGQVLGGGLSGEISIGRDIRVGDKVAMLRSRDGQELVIICKAVGV